MNTPDETLLLSEKATLERMLAETPPEEVLTRASLQARLEVVEDELSQAQPPRSQLERARLTFRGRPVIGQQGIYAEFGAKAVSAFTDAVAMIAAALSGDLASTGPIPHRDESRLLITGTALGSFGFELEAAPQPGRLDLGDASVASQALRLTQNLLRGTVGTDEELADSAAELNRRAVAGVRTFLDCLVANDAVCGLQVGESLFQFQDVGQVRRGVDRLSEPNLHEEETELRGVFQGALPDSRSFEFRVAESGEVIRGKIGPSIGTPETVNQHLGQPTVIEVLEKRVLRGKPRYVLIRLPAAWQSPSPTPEKGN
jgi:hypothetical protein